MSKPKFHVIIEYEDSIVQPIILASLRSQISPNLYTVTQKPGAGVLEPSTSVLQIRSYETIDFEHSLQNLQSLCNAYVIRKALIRKHYLSNTINNWTTKNPESKLAAHYKPAVEFELDYAEFLDEALLEAYELTESFTYNQDKDPSDSQWWILKPSMSDRGQGIRIFRTEQDLVSIFEEWEAENPDSDEDEASTSHEDVHNGDASDGNRPVNGSYGPVKERIMTSHLRHFVAQPYIHPPLLIPEAPYDNRKFHIRTYVVAAGALRVYVYQHMLALFASKTYEPPWITSALEADGQDDHNNLENEQDLLQHFRNIHLTNTCVQSATTSSPPRDAVFLLSSLPLSTAVQDSLMRQISDTTASLFRAAAAQPTNFQALPQAFEIYGLDFLVDASETVWLLEVNAFPDFAQTGEDLKDKVIGGLFEEVFRQVVGPFFGIEPVPARDDHAGRFVKVLDMDLGRR